MDYNEIQENSRREFIKKSSLFWIGSIVLGDPAVQLVSEALGIRSLGEKTPAFSCELFRCQDLMHFKYYFYNAKLSGRNIKSTGKEPCYILIQVPRQHIAEGLLVDVPNEWKDFKKQKSFLAKSSWLGFKLPENLDMDLTPESLINWIGWDMLTIDDFAKADNPEQPDYEATLPKLSTAFGDGWMYDNAPERYLPNNVPLTTFEIPYKMFLSPIALSDETDEKKLMRLQGDYIFLKNNAPQIHHIDKRKKNGQIEIISPWQNTLVFKDLRQNISPPRFKIVKYIGQECDIDDKTELLPAPIQRYDLNGLTMLPEYDRDVISDYFMISARGGTTSLKYKHDDPTAEHALAAWDQIIKDGRDNFTRVTYRAVDVFTGLKLLISIVAPRDFKAGVSFLPKLYHVAYAEKEKNYDAEETKSKLPFVKIIPQTEGAYFTPFDIKEDSSTKSECYLVAKPKENQDGSTQLESDKLLDFEYIGIDKNGVEHKFKSKIIFIPAERYEITSAEPYIYEYEGIREVIKTGKSVGIKFIGFLNPYRNEAYNGDPPVADCPENPVLYKFKMIKTFSSLPAEVGKLGSLIDKINAHINVYSDVYKNIIRADVTYAKINKLKEGKSPKISKSSTNATFKTEAILLNAEQNLLLKAPDGEPIDYYLSYFPLVPTLKKANVTISQVDQIRGQNEYYWVSYYDKYRDSQDELEDYDANDLNNAYIFFKLVTPIDNFFTGNYKSSGAMVNPGIKISHVSALDNSISFNESHNDKAIILTDVHGISKVNTLPAIPAVSIFKELDAEILGISMLDILQEFMPVGDIPVLEFAKEMEQTIARITQLAQEYKELAEAWIAEYDKAVAEVKDYAEKIKAAKDELESLAKNGVREWLDTYIEQSNMLFFFEDQSKALQSYTTEYQQYSKECVEVILTKLKNINPVVSRSILVAIDTFITKPDTIAFKNFLVTVYDHHDIYSERQIKELLKAFYTAEFINHIKPDNRIENAINTASSFAREIDERYLSYYNAAVQGMQESLAFSRTFVKSKQKLLADQLTDTVKFIPKVIEEALAKLDIKPNQIDKTIGAIYRLAKVYENYKRLYTDLQSENYERFLIDSGLVDNVLITDLRKNTQIIEQQLISSLKLTIKGIEIPKNIDTAVINAFNSVKDKLAEIASKSDALRKFEERVPLESIKSMVGAYTALAGKYYAEYDNAQTLLLFYEEKIKNPEKTVRDFLNNQLQKLFDDLKEKSEQMKAEFIRNGKSSPLYLKLSAEVSRIESFVKKIKELSKQKLEYTMYTKKFRKASLGGVIEFIPEPGITDLKVFVKYEIEFAITAINKPPSITKQTWITDTTLRAFKLGLLQLLYIDFEKVSFVTGSDVKDDFTVRIKNVEFGGFLAFFQAFQEYLKSISDNLVFDIDANGAKIGYGVTIPDFPAGYFNFFNLNLSGMLVLPFQPEKSMQMHFGIGNELNKFGLTVMVIFGGQGYFKIIAEPKRGIVGMEVVLEFGAIFNLNLTIVKGTAYMVGGIYIRQYDGQFDLRAYILCVGRLRVLGLFSASLSFYMALGGTSEVLEGVCRVRASHKFGPFFEISVECEMKKTLKGARTNKDPQSSGPDGIRSVGTYLNNNSSKEVYYDDESLLLIIATTNDVKPVAILRDIMGDDVTPRNIISQISRNLFEINAKLKDYKAGRYTLEVDHSSQKDIYTIDIVNTKNPCELSKKIARDIPANEYYASYFYNA
ncbi:hypothetical protein [Flavobacterium daejeonense]|uniref:hypothetical protein n=1 Tax=Flavobacterium daejeonense TaxID=350893 RepID=UPI00047E2787|nr:hypothetical protein [Flavobacterium daejeonense]